MYIKCALAGQYGTVIRVTRSMMFRYMVFAAVVYFVSILQAGYSYRILAVCPAPSISHQVVFRGLTLALNKRGHELVVVTPDPINDPSLTNYTEIVTRFGYDTFSVIPFVESRGKVSWLEWLRLLDHRTFDLTDRILDHPDLRKLYAPDSNEKFDLVIVELLFWHGLYPLARRFDAPTIGFVSMGLHLNNLYNTGSPILTSHPSNWELESAVSEQLAFWQRLKNFITVWSHVYWYRTTYKSGHTAVAKKYFGNDIPDLDDLEKNVSLIFVNQQGPISYAKPDVPKVISIGGFHISKETTNMPKDLQEILDGATTGFIYMSLGSNVKSVILPNQTLNAFITAFSRLPYQVLWKFEDEVLPNKPDNVHIMKWIPQQAVLAHPNLKVFIYQGGVQSTEEAVHHAVPLIGFPVIWDQDMQVNKMVSLGVAKKLEITAVDADELFQAITTVASDHSYKERMLNLRSIIDDKPYDPLENAVWWTEHVIRHGGAPHLHSTTADEPWYRRQDMDIVAFLSAGFVVILGFILVILYQLSCSVHFTVSAGSRESKKTN